MSLLYFLKRLYSLDTLDTRFTHSSKVPVRTASAERGIDISKPAVNSEDDVTKQSSVPKNTQPSRWNTLEYYVYYVVFLVMVPLMFYVPYSVSKGDHVRVLLSTTQTLMYDRIESPIS